MTAENGAPHLTGYHYVKDIGSGGTARVYLYEQEVPSRLVAVKVDRQQLHGDQAQKRFRTEANSMAALASHPNILTIYDAGITQDDHSYLVLEYAPNGTFKDIRKRETLSLDQVLSIGIQMCSALQTAHSAGIIHRDIKPGNILCSRQGTPLLSDFGIAATIYDTNAQGYSIPWAAPEVLRHETSGNEASDIYSLGATLVGLLGGRSPYELAFSPHSPQELENLALTQELPAFSHMGLPPVAGPVLRKALAHNPDERYYSALDFARSLQKLQMRVSGHQTPTSVAGKPDYLPEQVSQRKPSSTSLSDGSQARSVGSEKAAAAPSSGFKAWMGVGIIAIVLAAVVAMWFLVIQPKADTVNAPDHIPSVESQPGLKNDDTNDPSDTSVAQPKGAEGKIEGTTARFTWKNPDPEPGDTYFWKQVDSDDQGTTTPNAEATLENVTTKQVCLQVSIVRANHQMSKEPTTVCAVRE